MSFHVNIRPFAAIRISLAWGPMNVASDALRKVTVTFTAKQIACSDGSPRPRMFYSLEQEHVAPGVRACHRVLCCANARGKNYEVGLRYFKYNVYIYIY
jgi:hypothetical protein